MELCADQDCSRPVRKRGFCDTHYERRRRSGEIARIRISDPAQRFWSYVKRTGYCWQWQGAKSTAGYGRINWHGRVEQAHRVSYELCVGPAPRNLDLDHLCRNRGCVRPDHLQPVTRQVNLLRGQTLPAANAAKTHCGFGHEYTPENTYLWRDGRHCRTCRSAVQASRIRIRRTVVTINCVMCGIDINLERKPGQTPNVCSEACRKDRQRRTAREWQRRKRAN